MKKKLIGEIRFLIVNFLVAPAIGILICLLEAIGRIKFVNFSRFPIWEERLIMVSNHPSLLEPIVLPLIGFPWMNFPWIFSPLLFRVKFSLSWVKQLRKEFALQKKLTPANVPDRNNFYDSPYWGLFRGINVPVDRNGGMHVRLSTVQNLRSILDNGGRVLLFPEGTRTFKAIQQYGASHVNGKALGKLKDGAAWLALKTNARVLPIWVEGTDKVLPNNKLPIPRLWHRITIKIGTPFVLPSLPRKEATEYITEALLKVAEE